MRDTILVLAFMISMAVGIYYYNEKKVPLKYINQAHMENIRKEYQTPTTINHKPSDKLSHNKNIYSIYPTSSQNDDDDENREIEKKSSYGVPFIRLARLMRNSIHKIPPTTDTNMLRIFVQCMELKKTGPRYLNQKECKELSENMLSLK